MTETLANLSWPTVLLIVVILLGLRFLLLKVDQPYAKSAAEVAESLAVAMALVFFIIRPFLVQAFFIPSGSMHPTLLENDHILVNKLGYRFFDPQPGDVVVFLAPGEWDQDDQTEKDYIKRLIAAPGDTIEVQGGEFRIGAQRIRRDELRRLIVQNNLAPITSREVQCKYLPEGIQTAGHIISKEELARWLGTSPENIEITPGRTLRNGEVVDEPYTLEDPDYDLPPVTIGEEELFVMGDNRNNSNDSHRNGALEDDRLIGKAMFIFWPPNRWQVIR